MAVTQLGKKVSFGVKILNFGMSEHGLSVHAFFPARKQIAAFLLCKVFLLCRVFL